MPEGGGEAGVLPEKFGGGVQLASQNPYQNLHLLGVLFKIPDKQPSLFYMEVHPLRGMNVNAQQ